MSDLQAVEIAEAATIEDAKPKGGFDGVLVTFGDGCDDDTLNIIFGGSKR